jgi:YfiH family protein
MMNRYDYTPVGHQRDPGIARDFYGVPFGAMTETPSSDAECSPFYFQFPELRQYGNLRHAVFTRHGGVSRPPFDSLNISYGTDDDPEAVATNLSIIKTCVGAPHLAMMNQVHGDGIVVLRQGNARTDLNPRRADALVTDIPGIALMVKQADCQSVVLFDPEHGVISNIHCGWRGNRSNILGAVTERMRSEFGCLPPMMLAAIGPSLGPCCGEFSGYRDIFPAGFRKFMTREGYFDLWEISRHQLIDAGLRAENITTARMCTRCRTDLFFSYRAERQTGRFGTVVLLTP